MLKDLVAAPPPLSHHVPPFLDSKALVLRPHSRGGWTSGGAGPRASSGQHLTSWTLSWDWHTLAVTLLRNEEGAEVPTYGQVSGTSLEPCCCARLLFIIWKRGAGSHQHRGQAAGSTKGGGGGWSRMVEWQVSRRGGWMDWSNPLLGGAGVGGVHVELVPAQPLTDDDKFGSCVGKIEWVSFFPISFSFPLSIHSLPLL
uniref:Uncharacterized protein n=1 Tax=Sphaerodactylus townsendi TaxID=933632 RepID=A0ACB8FU37_9SAUR